MQLYEPKVGNDIIDTFINAYLITLGEFEYEGFEGSNNNYLWSIFISATFVIQITFLNMLIAIM